ncbi:MAG: NADH:ubiquinone oxidoreductase [Candidatus Baldrarchaeia archaeon]
MINKKPKVGIFSLASCEGCIVQILNLEDQILDLLSKVNIVDFRVLKEEKEKVPLDIAFIEGCITSEKDVKKVKELRENSKILVALGECACTGGKFLVKDFKNHENPLQLKEALVNAQPLDQYVTVDYYLYGCPIDKNEFLELFKNLLIGKTPRPKSYNVCAECILHEKACLIEAGLPCLGPIIRGGCNAICSSVGKECIGCRGLAEDANIDSLIEIFQKHQIEVSSFLKHLQKLQKSEVERR